MDILNKTNLDKEQFIKLTETIPNKTSLLELLYWGNKKNISVTDVITELPLILKQESEKNNKLPKIWKKSKYT